MDREKIDILTTRAITSKPRRKLSRWYWDVPAGAREIEPQLNKMEQSLYFSPQPPYYDSYAVQPGPIARRRPAYKPSWKHLELNRGRAEIRMGQKLKMSPAVRRRSSTRLYELSCNLGAASSELPRRRRQRWRDAVGTFTVRTR